MTAKQAQSQTQTSAQKSSPTLKIDLRGMDVASLLELKTELNNVLADIATHNIGPNDIVVDYCITLRTQEGVAAVNEGSVRMNAITNKRLLPEAPRRFETEIQHQVYSPIYAAALDIFEDTNDIGLSLESITQQAGSGRNIPVLPGLPATIV